jgi:sulfur-oxidizing protein SoxB
MVRLGGLNYTCDPLATMNSRISELTLDDGRSLEAGKKYKVAGWATVGSQSPGPPVWDVVAEYLRAEPTIRVTKINTPKLKNVSSNPGLSDYSGIVA